MENVNQQEKVVYTGKTLTTGGREGASQSSDGRLDIKLTSPGAVGQGTNPEQLLAAGWSACFIGAMGKTAAEMKLRLPSDTSVNAEIDLVLGENGYSLQARLNISLPGIDRETAQAIAAGAHLVCPYSKALHGNIKIETNIL